MPRYHFLSFALDRILAFPFHLGVNVFGIWYFCVLAYFVFLFTLSLFLPSFYSILDSFVDIDYNCTRKILFYYSLASGKPILFVILTRSILGLSLIPCLLDSSWSSTVAQSTVSCYHSNLLLYSSIVDIYLLPSSTLFSPRCFPFPSAHSCSLSATPVRLQVLLTCVSRSPHQSRCVNQAGRTRCRRAPGPPPPPSCHPLQFRSLGSFFLAIIHFLVSVSDWYTRVSDFMAWFVIATLFVSSCVSVCERVATFACL